MRTYKQVLHARLVISLIFGQFVYSILPHTSVQALAPSTKLQEVAQEAVLARARQLEELAKPQNFQGKSKQDILADPNLGPAYIRWTVLEYWKSKNPVLYEKAKDVMAKLFRGDLDPTAFPPELQEVLEGFYGIGKEDFKMPERLGLRPSLERNLAPQFEGSYIKALGMAFPEIGLNPLGFTVYQGLEGWSDPQNSTAYIRYRVAKYKPEVWGKYLEVKRKIEKGQINTEEYPPELQEVLDGFYEIASRDFAKADRFGIGAVYNRNLTPQFEGSYMKALEMAFPGIGLNPLGFATYHGREGWADTKNSTEYIRYRMAKYKPALWTKYLEIKRKIEQGQINWEEYPPELQEVLDGFYESGIEDFHKADRLGLASVLNRNLAPQFQGSYVKALKLAFPEIRLNPLGFVMYKGSEGWEDVHNSIEYVRYRMAKYKPGVWVKYLAVKRKIDQGRINTEKYPPELQEVLEGFYGISAEDFMNAGRLGPQSVLDRNRAPQFEGSHIKVLEMAFPEIGLNPLGFLAYRGPEGWADTKNSTEYIRYRMAKYMPEVWEKYLKVKEKIQLGQINRKEYPPELQEVLNGFYGVGVEDFNKTDKLRLGPALNRNQAPQFEGSYVKALEMAFPEMGLNPLGFAKYRGPNGWDDLKNSMEYVRYRVAEYKPEVWGKYLELKRKIEKGQISTEEYPPELQEVLDGFYGIGSEDFKTAGRLGLHSALNRNLAPQFEGTHVKVLKMAFPEIGLNPLGFQGYKGPNGWDDLKNPIEYIRYRMAKYKPEIWIKYLEVRRKIETGQVNTEEYPPDLKEVLEVFYGIGKGDFQHADKLGLRSALNRRLAPQFKGSHRVALAMSFPELPLKYRTSQEAFQNLRRHLEEYVSLAQFKSELKRIASDASLTDKQRMRLLIGRLISMQQRFGIQAFLELLEKSGFAEEYAQTILEEELLSWFGTKAAIKVLVEDGQRREKGWPQRVLDAGAGPSTLSRAMEALEQRANTTDLDASEAMLRYGLKGNARIAGDMAKLPLGTMQDGMFELVHFGFALHYPREEDRAKALMEAARVLRQGGHITILSPMEITEEFVKAAEEMGFGIVARPKEGSWVQMLLLEKKEIIRFPVAHRLLLGEKRIPQGIVRLAQKIHAKEADGIDGDEDPSLTDPDIVVFEGVAAETPSKKWIRKMKESVKEDVPPEVKIKTLEEVLGEMVDVLGRIEDYEMFKTAALELFDQILASGLTEEQIKRLEEQIRRFVGAKRGKELNQLLRVMGDRNLLKIGENTRQKEQLEIEFRANGWDWVLLVQGRGTKKIAELMPELSYLLGERLRVFKRGSNVPTSSQGARKDINQTVGESAVSNAGL